MQCIICKLPLVEQQLSEGLPLSKSEKKQYKKDIIRENSIQKCDKCTRMIKVKEYDNTCKYCDGTCKILSKKATLAYHKWMVNRPYYPTKLSCPVHGDILRI